MITIWFCPTCGAANEQVNTLCFACKQGKEQEPDENATGEGQLLNERYRLGTTVGSGGFSIVYRAIDTQVNERVVAIKQINLQGLSAEESIDATDTFNREVALLAELQHPQIPTLYDHFSDREHWYLVLEFIEGETLEHYLSRQTAPDKSLPLEEVLTIGSQLCIVLEYLHAYNPPVIFRDLKPGNIMRSPNGKLALIDFGIARRYRPGQARDTQRLGSPGYASPEQYGQAQTTPQADIYSLGAILHQLLTGEDPSSRGRGLAPRLLDRQAKSSGMENLLQSMLAQDPAERPASIKAVVQDLNQSKQLTAHQSGHIWVPPTPQAYNASASKQFQIQLQKLAGTVQPTKRRHTRRNVLIGLGLLGAAAGVGTWLQFRATPYVYAGHGYSVQGLSWSPDSKQIASIEMDATLQIWSAHNGEASFICDLTDIPNGVTWSPDGKYLVVVTTGGLISLWNATNGESTGNYQATNELYAAAWRPDSQQLAVANNDHTVEIWEGLAENGSIALTYQKHNDRVLSVAWSPDSTRLVSADDDGTIYVWNATTGSTLTTYLGHRASVNGVAWSPDGKNIASVSDDGTFQVWEATTGSLLFTSTKQSVEGNPTAIQAVSWAPNGKYIVMGSSDSTAQVWDASDGHLIYTYTGHTSTINSIEYSFDSQFIATGSADKTVQVWQPPQS